MEIIQWGLKMPDVAKDSQTFKNVETFIKLPFFYGITSNVMLYVHKVINNINWKMNSQYHV